MPSIGKEKRSSNAYHSDAPGPGQYTPQIEATSLMPHQPKWSIHGTKSREMPIIKDLPGPGSYQIKHTLSQRAPIICGRHKIIDKERKPGPWNYRTDISELSKISFSIGKSKRNTEPKSHSPGPGCYQIYYKTSGPNAGFSIGKESRSHSEMEKTVGPGTYNLPTTLQTKRGWVMGEKRERTNSIITPGPDAYNTVRKEKVKCYVIGRGKRLGVDQNTNSPGPAFYEPKQTDSGFGFSIGRQKKFIEKCDELPGPGQYNPAYYQSAPQYSMLSRYMNKYQNLGPGPQAYNLHDTKDTRAISFTQSKREASSLDKVPGPGSYMTEVKQQNTAIIFGREKRSYTRVEDIPGPGKYQIKSIFEKRK